MGQALRLTLLATLVSASTLAAQRLELSSLDDFIAPADLKAAALAAHARPLFLAAHAYVGAGSLEDLRGRLSSAGQAFESVNASAFAGYFQGNLKATWLQPSAPGLLPTWRGVAQISAYVQEEDSAAARYRFSYIVERPAQGALDHGLGVNLQVSMLGIGTGDYYWSRMQRSGETTLGLNFLNFAGRAGPVAARWGLGYNHLRHAERFEDGSANIWAVPFQGEVYIRALRTVGTVAVRPEYISRTRRWRFPVEILLDRTLFALLPSRERPAGR